MGCTIDRSWRRDKRAATTPVLLLLGWFLMMAIASVLDDLSTVRGFVAQRSILPKATSRVTCCPAPVGRTCANDEAAVDSTVFLGKKDTEFDTSSPTTSTLSPAESNIQQQYQLNNSSADQASNDASAWIQRMNEYFFREQSDIFRGNNVAVILSPLPSKECLEIASSISDIATNTNTNNRLTFVISPQDREINDYADDEDNAGDELAKLVDTKKQLDAANQEDSNKTNIIVVESIDIDDAIDTDAIDVVLLSTKSWRVVKDDSFINDFLRRTDAWIHMGSEFSDDFGYYTRLQEGANITLW